MGPSGMMMGPSNPYGPSVPPPPGISSQHPLGIPGPPSMGMHPNPMYPHGVPGSAIPHGSHPSQQGGMPPKHPNPRNMSNIQLQQLSAQIKAYRLLSRNVNPPEALMSIVHGRKLTPAMLAALQSSKNPSLAGSRGGGVGSPGGGGAGGGQSAPSPNPSPGPGLPTSGGGGGGGGGNINLYPPSPSLSQQGNSPKTPQQQQQATSSSLMRATSATSINSISAAPNVTISSGGELPLPVRQAMSAAQAGSTSSVAATMTPSRPVMAAAARGVAVSSSASSVVNGAPPPPAGGKAASLVVKQIKLGPPGKPVGIDPLVIMKERENR